MRNQFPYFSGAETDQTVSVDSSLDYTHRAYTDDDPFDILTATATLASGAALPSWITYTPSTRKFDFDPTDISAAASSPYSIRIRIRDNDSGGTGTVRTTY